MTTETDAEKAAKLINEKFIARPSLLQVENMLRDNGFIFKRKPLDGVDESQKNDSIYIYIYI